MCLRSDEIKTKNIKIGELEQEVKKLRSQLNLLERKRGDYGGYSGAAAGGPIPATEKRKW